MRRRMGRATGPVAVVTAVVAAMLSGCGGPNADSSPATSRLPVGSQAMLYAPAPATTVRVQIAQRGDPEIWGPLEEPVGLGVRVVDDSAEGGPERPVRIALGIVTALGKVKRDQLRPVK